MAKTLEKARKQIAKKHKGVVNGLHEKSRDSRKLHKAQVRDERLEKLAHARKKRDRPLLQRVSFFRDHVRENSDDQQQRPLSLEKVQSGIQQFVHQHDEEYDAITKARRPGRPPSTREDLLKMKMEALEKEHRDGFYLPDLTVASNIEALEKWEGAWSYLTNLTWVKISADGQVKASTFPPKGH